MNLYANIPLAISDDGAEFIVEREGFELEAYQDVKGIWTIGVGHIVGVHRGMLWTEQQVVDAFQKDVQDYVDAVNDCVGVALSQKQYDALVSLCFNIGTTGFSNSTLVRRLNEGEYRLAADQFLVWNKVRIMNRLREVEGLSNRRKLEREMFLEGIW
tara:strand:- start:16201 stop:16671 length:471 start_codon:yes stop_codon:yes gene_type:complete